MARTLTRLLGLASAGARGRHVRRPGAHRLARVARRPLIIVQVLAVLALALPLLSLTEESEASVPSNSVGVDYAAGALIIDMGVDPQTVGNALKPYGMVYDLLVHHQIPVAWSIKNGKSARRETDFTASNLTDLRTNTAVASREFKGGSFIIPAEFAAGALAIYNGGHADTYTAPKTANTFTTTYQSWKAQGVVMYRANAALSAPRYALLTSFPRLVLDAQNGGIAQSWYASAGFPSATVTDAQGYKRAEPFVFKPPAALNSCDDLYIMPHADPTWLTHSNLLTQNNNGMGIWAGCHAVSVLENLVSPDGAQRMNFLSRNAMPISDTEAVTTTTAAPTGPLQILVSQNRVDTDANGFGDAGDRITYTYTLINRGSTALSSVAVTDSVAATPACTVSIAAGAQSTCTRLLTLTAAQRAAGSVVNAVTATPNAGSAVSESLTTVTGTAVPERGLQVLKTAVRADSDSPKNGFGDVGDTITYAYRVFNPGPQLSAVNLTDDKLGAITCPATTLAGGVAMTCTSKVVTLTQAQVDGAAIANTATVAGTAPAGLVPFGSHAGPSVNRDYSPDWSDPLMQFMDLPTAAQLNGSEQVYLPYTGWRSSSKVLASDPTQTDLVASGGKLSLGEAVTMIYGRGFGQSSNGFVMYQGGHNIGGTGLANIAAVRAFFDYNLLVGYDRATTVTQISTGASPTVTTAGTTLSVDAGGGKGPYTYRWTSSCGGTFNAATGTSTDGKISTVFTPPAAALNTDCVLRVVITDDCGRVTFQAVSKTIALPGDIVIKKQVASPGVTGPVASTGVYTVNYDVTVTNNGAGPGTFSPITDTPSFAGNLAVTGVTWSRVNGGSGSASGPGPFTIGSGGTLAPGESRTWSVAVTFRYSNTTQATACAGTGTGLFNTASTVVDSGTRTATACVAPPTVPGKVTITKSMTFNPTVAPSPDPMINGTVCLNGVGGSGTNQDFNTNECGQYTFTVRNTGLVNLSNVVVSDSRFTTTNSTVTTNGVIPCPATTLAAGAAMTCTVWFKFPNNDNSISNSASVSGVPAGVTSGTVTASTTYVAYQPNTGTSRPVLSATKTLAPSSSTFGVGSVLTYTYELRNTGTRNADNLVLTDSLPLTAGIDTTNCKKYQGTYPTISGTSNINSTLEDGRWIICTLTYTATAADVTRGSIVNTLTATTSNHGEVVATSGASTPTTGALGDRVWNDVNSNGIQDTGEVGLAGVVVTVLNVNTGFTRTSTSDANGAWSATGLPLGSYSVTYDYSAVAGTFFPTVTGQGTTATDSNVNGVTYNVYTSTADNSIDFGFTRRPAIKLTKTAALQTDANGNGQRDIGDTLRYTFTVENTGGVPLTGVTVTDLMFNGGAPINCSPSTLAVGAQSVCATRDYVLKYEDAQAAGVINTATAAGTASGLTVSSTSTVTSPVNGLAEVGDRVWSDLDGNGLQDRDQNGAFLEPGIEGVKVTVNGPGGTFITYSDVNGQWFVTVPAGTYTVTYDTATRPAGYTTSPSNVGGDTTVDSNPNGASYSFTAGQTNLSLDFGLVPPPVSIGDRVWDDRNANGVQDPGEPGIPGVRITVTNATSGVTATATTNSSGIWGLSVAVGSYLVDYDPSTVPAGYSPSPTLVGSDRAADSNIRNNEYTFAVFQNDLTLDFGFYGPSAVRLAKIATLTKDANGNGVVDPDDEITYAFTAKNTGVATLNLSYVTDLMFPTAQFTCATTTLAPDQEVTCNGGPSRVYTVTGAEPLTTSGMLQNTATVYATGADGGLLESDASAERPAGGSVGDRVWFDANANGIQDSGEAGVQGVMVTARNTETTVTYSTTTSVSGLWQLQLPPGTYTIGYTRPDNFSPSPELQGADRTLDSSPSGVTVTIIAGVADTTVDFGLMPLSAITVEKYASNCDVGVPSCRQSGAEFALYDVDPTSPGATPINNGITVDPTYGWKFTSVTLTYGKDYWLVETKAPAGFNLLAQPARFTISPTGIQYTSTPHDAFAVKAAPSFTFTVTDAAVAPLPEAGGSGPWPFLLVGSGLVLLALVAGTRNSGYRRRPEGPAAS